MDFNIWIAEHSVSLRSWYGREVLPCLFDESVQDRQRLSSLYRRRCRYMDCWTLREDESADDVLNRFNEADMWFHLNGRRLFRPPIWRGLEGFRNKDFVLRLRERMIYLVVQILCGTVKSMQDIVWNVDMHVLETYLGILYLYSDEGQEWWEWFRLEY